MLDPSHRSPCTKPILLAAMLHSLVVFGWLGWCSRCDISVEKSEVSSQPTWQWRMASSLHAARRLPGLRQPYGRSHLGLPPAALARGSALPRRAGCEPGVQHRRRGDPRLARVAPVPAPAGGTARGSALPDVPRGDRVWGDLPHRPARLAVQRGGLRAGRRGAGQGRLAGGGVGPGVGGPHQELGHRGAGGLEPLAVATVAAAGGLVRRVVAGVVGPGPGADRAAHPRRLPNHNACRVSGPGRSTCWRGRSGRPCCGSWCSG